MPELWGSFSVFSWICRLKSFGLCLFCGLVCLFVLWLKLFLYPHFCLSGEYCGNVMEGQVNIVTKLFQGMSISPFVFHTHILIRYGSYPLMRRWTAAGVRERKGKEIESCDSQNSINVASGGCFLLCRNIHAGSSAGFPSALLKEGDKHLCEPEVLPSLLGWSTSMAPQVHYSNWSAKIQCLRAVSFHSLLELQVWFNPVCSLVVEESVAATECLELVVCGV